MFIFFGISLGRFLSKLAKPYACLWCSSHHIIWLLS